MTRFNPNRCKQGLDGITFECAIKDECMSEMKISRRKIVQSD